MPLGVEHVLRVKIQQKFQQVFKPLMPLGVEHWEWTQTQSSNRQYVFKPLMPLGVEHLTCKVEKDYDLDRV